ncbi:MAG: RNA-directed DNA polymerase [Rickettsiales bacterium]|jgi:retron-type reverse transcriptase|nr:RNA-directed DNA polymerase [Rickettsiales bacterium]
MKRLGNIWKKIISKENFEKALTNAIRGKSRLRSIGKFKENKESNLEKVRQLLVEKKFKTSKYKERTVFEPKKRIIYVLPFSPDRIIHHALLNILEPYWNRLFISTSYSCRKKYGIHKGSTKTMEYVRNNKYCLKCDISKFYPSIDHKILIEIIEKKIKDKDALWLIREIINSFPGEQNVPIGNYTSQWFGNIYMNELDTYIKHELKIKDYIRYCDDFLLFGNDKNILNEARKKIEIFINEKLKLKFSKCDLFQTKQGVDFLGYRHFKKYILLRKSTKKRVEKRLKLLPKLFEKQKITKEQYLSSVGSTYGWLKWANTHNLNIKLQLDALFKKVKFSC